MSSREDSPPRIRTSQLSLPICCLVQSEFFLRTQPPNKDCDHGMALQGHDLQSDVETGILDSK